MNYLTRLSLQSFRGQYLYSCPLDVWKYGNRINRQVLSMEIKNSLLTGRKTTKICKIYVPNLIARMCNQISIIHVKFCFKHIIFLDEVVIITYWKYEDESLNLPFSGSVILNQHSRWAGKKVCVLNSANAQIHKTKRNDLVVETTRCKRKKRTKMSVGLVYMRLLGEI